MDGPKSEGERRLKSRLRSRWFESQQMCLYLVALNRLARLHYRHSLIHVFYDSVFWFTKDAQKRVLTKRGPPPTNEQKEKESCCERVWPRLYQIRRPTSRRLANVGPLHVSDFRASRRCAPSDWSRPVSSGVGCARLHLLDEPCHFRLGAPNLARWPLAATNLSPVVAKHTVSTSLLAPRKADYDDDENGR